MKILKNPAGEGGMQSAWKENFSDQQGAGSAGAAADSLSRLSQDSLQENGKKEFEGPWSGWTLTLVLAAALFFLLLVLLIPPL